MLALGVPRHGQQCHTQQRRLLGLWEGDEKLNSHSKKGKTGIVRKKKKEKKNLRRG